MERQAPTKKARAEKTPAEKTPAEKASPRKAPPKTVVVRARVAPTIKDRAERILAGQGLSPGDAIRLFYHHVIKCKGLPLSMCEPNAATLKALEDARAGRNLTRHKDVDEMFGKLGIECGDSEA